MYMNKRAKLLKSAINFENETEKEIRSDIEVSVLKNSIRVFEHKH